MPVKTELMQISNTRAFSVQLDLKIIAVCTKSPDNQQQILLFNSDEEYKGNKEKM